MRPIIIRFALTLIFCISQLPAQADESENATTALKLGFILPLSGEWSYLGNGIRNGAVLAAEDTNGENRPTLIFQDNRGDLAESVSAVRRLIEIDKVDAVVSIISGVAEAIRPIATARGVISIGICSDPGVADGRYSFINYLTAEQGVARYLDYFQQRHGKDRSISVLTMNEAGFQRISNTLRTHAPAAKVRVIAEESFNKGERDFRLTLLRLKQNNPDSLLILGLSPEIELIAKQAREVRLEATLSSIESFGLASDISAFEGAWFVDSATPPTEFIRRFEERFQTKLTPGAGHAYDTVGMLVASYRQRDWHDRFRSIRGYNGTLGALQVQADGVIWTAASIKEIKEGQIRVLSEQ